MSYSTRNASNCSKMKADKESLFDLLVVFLTALFIILFCSCSVNRVNNKTSIRLLDEFRVDEYRGYVVTSMKPDGKWTNCAVYSEEKKRFCYIRIPSWLAGYYQEGDTIR